jgi:hypothetical protein
VSSYQDLLDELEYWRQLDPKLQIDQVYESHHERESCYHSEEYESQLKTEAQSYVNIK